jgi:hypothetical protein
MDAIPPGRAPWLATEAVQPHEAGLLHPPRCAPLRTRDDLAHDIDIRGNDPTLGDFSRQVPHHVFAGDRVETDAVQDHSSKTFGRTRYRRHAGMLAAPRQRKRA